MHAYTLTLTDIATGWTENRSVPSKARKWVLAALEEIAKTLPFPLLGVDSDNGSEFINHHLLVGLPEAIEATFPRATVQTCVVHLIRASMRFVSYTERKKVAAALRPIYNAANADAAETALLELTESDLGKRHPAVIATWQRAWERFTPFLAFPPDVRKIIYTTNAVVISSPLGAVVDVHHAPVRLRGSVVEVVIPCLSITG